jgi:hypothetical protein
MIDRYIDRKISESLVAKNELERKNHKSSGKLSASMLGSPLQWQILKSMGVPQKEVDEYTLRKFLRGKQVEEWIVSYLDPIETQKFVEYKGCIGFVDAICDTKEWDFKNGIIPVEVKSVTNMKFKRIEKQGGDRSHLLQGALYALALKSPKFAVLYVASDDYRIHLTEHDSEAFRGIIDDIIALYDKQKATNRVPAFEPMEKWQGDLKYNSYPLFSGLREEEATLKAIELIK